MGKMSSGYSLASQIKLFNELQKFCLSYEHGIRPTGRGNHLYQDSSDQPYSGRPASTFIYAFFVFSSIYNINWQTSLQNPTQDPEVYQQGQLSEQGRFWSLVDVCYQNNPHATQNYAEYLRNYCDKLGVNDPPRNLKGIVSAKNADLEKKLADQYKARNKNGAELSMQSIEDLRLSFRALYRYNPKTSVGTPYVYQKHLNNVLYFVYAVRNNVFHGKKGVAVAHIARSQENRLLVYAAILLAANQLMLDHAEQFI
ncbi:MAG: hypothetical protein K8L91_02520 [Anaerolineae bacterium]|nr:hypothetical protein [Anaerolineae bacterium]